MANSPSSLVMLKNPKKKKKKTNVNHLLDMSLFLKSCLFQSNRSSVTDAMLRSSNYAILNHNIRM